MQGGTSTAHLQQLALHVPASDSKELVDEVATIIRTNLAPHDHLPAMDSHSNTSELNDARADEPGQFSTIASEHRCRSPRQPVGRHDPPDRGD